MATGIERLMKSFGIDPEAIMKTFSAQMDEVVQQVKGEFDMLHDRMAAMELRLDSIERGLLHNLPGYQPIDAKEKLETTQLPAEVLNPPGPAASTIDEHGNIVDFLGRKEA